MPGFGPIITEACRCADAAPALGCVLSTAQNVINLMISLAALGVVAVIVYAGILFATTAANPEGHTKARKILLNAVVGFVIILAAWLMVDFVMKSFYNPGAFGPWNSILRQEGERCLVAKDNKPLWSGGIFTVPGVTGSDPTADGAAYGTGANCPAGDPAIMVAFPSAATSGETEKATPTTVQNFLAMRAAALKDGIDLKVTDGYRSDAEQVQLWNQYNHDTSQVAKPCSLSGGGSNHNSGTAVDIAVGCAKTNSSCNSAAYLWLKAHGAEWNFRNALPTDVVHWSSSGR